ncbi:MAG: hypothetical protein HYV07_29690 [Deltaproteobacteria bacterium]|nr:hypothetical protein [Deltaproteobacteria bacterium]
MVSKDAPGAQVIRRLGLEVRAGTDGSVRGTMMFPGRGWVRPEGVQLGARHDFALHGDAHLHFLPPSPLRLLGLVKFTGARDAEHLQRFVEASWNGLAKRTIDALSRARGYFSSALLRAETWQLVATLEAPKVGPIELVYFEEDGPTVAICGLGGQPIEPPIVVPLPTDPPSAIEARRRIHAAVGVRSGSAPAGRQRELSKAQFSAAFAIPVDLVDSLGEDERIPQDELSGSFVIGPDGFVEDPPPVPEPSVVAVEPSGQFEEEDTEQRAAATHDGLLRLPVPVNCALQAGFHRVDARLTHLDRTGLYGDWVGRRPKRGQTVRLVGVSAFSVPVLIEDPGPLGDAVLRFRPDPRFAEAQDALGVLLAMGPGPARSAVAAAALDAGALVLSTPNVLSLSASCALVHVKLIVIEPRAIERWRDLEGPLSLDERGRVIVVSEEELEARPRWAQRAHPRDLARVVAQELTKR